MHLGFVTVDCVDKERMLRFWSDALGWDIRRGVYTTLRSPDESVPGLYFQEVAEPRSGKNRLHLDLLSERHAEDVSRLTELGATLVREVDENGFKWSVMDDPEGNVFCVFDATD